MQTDLPQLPLPKDHNLQQWADELTRQLSTMMSNVYTDIRHLSDGVYGGIYCTGNTNATTISTQNTWYQIACFDTNGPSSETTPDHTNDHVLIDETGFYKILFTASFSGGAGKTYELQVKTSNGATGYENIHTERKLGSGGDIGACSGHGHTLLTAGDTVELWIRCTDVTTANAVVRDVNLTVQKIGAA